MPGLLRHAVWVFIAATVEGGASSGWATGPVAPTASDTMPSAEELPGVPRFAKVSDTLYRGAQPSREGFARG